MGLIWLIPLLWPWNIPEAVTGGLLASLAILGNEIGFHLEVRDMLLLYSFTAADLVASGRATYETAVATAGFGVITLGATPIAFIVPPLVSAFFIDLANAAAIAFIVG